MIRVSDYIAKFLVQHGVKHVFMMTGGGAMHLNDGLCRNPELEVVFNHHEQSCAIAAASYARLSGQLPVVNVTTGPGGLNALTGVFGAWTDSVPMFVISGQVRFDTTVASCPEIPLRQLGDQEYPIIDAVKRMTKYAVMVTDPNSIRYHLEKALYLATHGRLGPVWLDIPINVQAAQINEERLEGFDPSTDFDVEQVPEVLMEAIQVTLEKLNGAKRPVVFVGGGIRASGAYKEFRALMDALKIPVVTAWNAHDVLPEEFPYYAGRPGTVGDRPGNFVTQKADVLLILGSRCNIRQISYNWENFAKNAYKIMVDIDAAEMQKPTLKIDLQIHGDLKDFLPKMLAAVKRTSMTSHQEWIDWCLACRQKYPIVLPEYWERKEKVNPYCFMELLSEKLPENQIIVTGNGSACVTSFQAMKLKEGQRLYTNSGCAAMGYGFPAAIGACVASGNEKIICLDGDGSFQLNIQELAQVDYHKYPIKIFVLNNKGYLSIRQTQSGFFGEPLFGIDDETGLGFPDLEILAKAYHLKFIRCDNHAHMSQQLDAVLAGNEPVLCEVMLTPEQFFAPKLSSRRLPDGSMISSSLEDMAPFLPEEEVQANMCTEED